MFGDKYRGCYALAVMIFALGIVRDYLYALGTFETLTKRFERALASQPAMTELQAPAVKYFGAALFLMGNTFVLSSMWALGVTGTYLGSVPYIFYIFLSYVLSNSRRLLWNIDGRSSYLIPVQCTR